MCASAKKFPCALRLEGYVACSDAEQVDGVPAGGCTAVLLRALTPQDPGMRWIRSKLLAKRRAGRQRRSSKTFSESIGTEHRRRSQ